jgi:isoleucyl-tRNA synthetase
VRGIQNLRKARGLEVTDRIELFLHGSDELKEAVEGFQDHLIGETLAAALSWEQRPDAVKIECGEEVCLASLRRLATGVGAGSGADGGSGTTPAEGEDR